MQLRRFALALVLSAAALPAAAQNFIHFDNIPGMPNGSGQIVPVASRLSNQYAATLGVTFASQSNFVAVVNHGAATPSVPNIIGGTSTTGALRYLSPVYLTFVDPANPTLAATTNFVSIRGDKNAIPGTATMKLFALDGTQIGMQTVNDVAGGLTLSLSQPGIHKVELTQTSGTIGFDNLTFNTVVPCTSVQRYCTAGTTTNGCVPSITAAGAASASATSGFTLSVQAVEGQKQGVLFYGISGPLAGQWGTGTSFLCVKSPSQRMPPSNSGGTAGQCNGVLSIDWCSFVSANPGALGTPFSSGDVVYVQGWFRDPAAPKTTNLSDALSFTVCP